MRLVLDTNILISSLLQIESRLGKAVPFWLRKYNCLFSEDTLNELIITFNKPKFGRYFTQDLVAELLQAIGRYGKMTMVTSSVTLCRDPKDNMFLALALDGRADYLITGDGDLLALPPNFRFGLWMWQQPMHCWLNDIIGNATFPSPYGKSRKVRRCLVTLLSLTGTVMVEG